MNQRSSEITVGRLYAYVAISVSILAVLCILLAAGLAVYSDEAGKSGGAVGDSITALWRCVFLLAGGLTGLLASPALATIQRN